MLQSGTLNGKAVSFGKREIVSVRLRLENGGDASALSSEVERFLDMSGQTMGDGVPPTGFDHSPAGRLS